MGCGSIVSGFCQVVSRHALAALAFCSFALAAPLARADIMSPTASDLDRMPIEDLARIEVSTVSKTVQPLSDAPAAIFVITHEDIIRSGATSLPDILRLAPNLQVAQITASNFAISARGFNGSAADKLLVLIDGRSIYTPFDNGVFWDAQDVLPEDIERIEVIRGPGATLWGANAVNGVINIITRKSSETQGGFIELGGGDNSSVASFRLGGRLRDDLTFRIYADGEDYGADRTATGASANDDWRHRQGGFRLDWSPAQDLVTLQGDLYHAVENEGPFPSDHASGHNVLVRWTHPTDGAGTVQVQAYYDYLQRKAAGSYAETLRTYDIEIQHNFALGGRQQVVWGAGFRAMGDDFYISPTNPSSKPLGQFFDPQRRTLNQGDLFAQDTIALTRSLKLIAGLKLEADPYSSVEPLPNLRLSWKVDDRNFIWAAVSRAVRAPSRLDRDFTETYGPLVYLTGGRFVSEKLVAYEVGYRAQPAPSLSVSIAAYYNTYDDLRSFELTPVTLLPIVIENKMEGETYGVEVSAAYQVFAWWRLSGGANWEHEDLRYKPGSAPPPGVGVDIAGNDPRYQASASSMMNLGHHVNFGLDLRGVGALPAPASPYYVEAGARVSWAVTDAVEISLRGDNLLNPHHAEFGAGNAHVQLGSSGVETERSWYLATRVRF